MGPNKSYSRIDTSELRSLIFWSVGHRRADKYFDLLAKLLNRKISKVEFDKSCVKFIGRENVPLHNRLIRSILKNACLAQVPPSKGIKKVDSYLNVRTANGNQTNCLQSFYGDAFPTSPRKARSSVNRDRRFRDRPSPLGPLGKPQSVVCEELSSRAKEQQSATELFSLGSRPPVEVVSVEEGEEVEQMAGSPGFQSMSSITAPLGISINLGGDQKSLSNASLCNNYIKQSFVNNGELPDTRTLRSHLQQMIEVEGMSVSLDCANLLNHAVDAYLKRLIEPCLALARARCGNVSMLDFCVAMESNPQMLGVDWPTKLEKILLRSFEED